jgi:pyruvate dehydrogenase E2 component (dihydrolipoamide acetyltransferase)
MALQDILIPDIGDAENVEVIEVLVAVGDEVRVDEGLIVVESDKASMEVPSPGAGRVESIEVGLGDLVQEGQLIVRLEPAEAQVELESVAPDKSPRQGSSSGSPQGSSQSPPTGSSAPDIERSASTVGDRFEVRVPDIGDAEGVEVIEVAVATGDIVAVDDLLVVVESDKASMEIPSPVAGRVIEVPIVTGAGVSNDTLLVVVETEGHAVDGDSGTSATSREPPDDPVAEVPEAAGSEAPRTPDKAAAVYAGPAVRRLARELGVDLAHVEGSGTQGRVLKDDVHAFVKKRLTGARTDSDAAGGIPRLPEIDFSRFGEVETHALSRIRARGAANLQRSWLNVPHVTQHDEADVTELEAFRRSLKSVAEARSVKLTPLAFIMRAVLHALKEFPTFNASLADGARAMVIKHYYHLGFAVDTDEGLVVPVVRNADQLGVFELAASIAGLSERARDGKLTIEDLSGGSFSISSLGGIGGTGFTPIVNAPEVAILGISRLVTKPRWNGESFEPRSMLPLSLSYDHRAINGAEAGRFIVRLCQLLGDIRHVLL